MTIVPSYWEQLAAVAGGFVIKPAYMALSLYLVLLLRRKKEADLVLFRRALIFFLVGESFCAVNYLFAAASSTALELGHQAGMILMSALLPWGIFRLADRRVLRFVDSASPCVAGRFCGRCWKRDGGACGMQRVFLFVLPALALVSLMPLTAPLRPLDTTLSIFGTEVPYLVDRPILLFEYRLYPAAAALLFTAAFILQLQGVRGLSLSEAPFFAGVGFLAFSLFRFFLLESYRMMPVWKDFWEELTELIVIVAVAVFLRVFRKTLVLAR